MRAAAGSELNFSMSLSCEWMIEPRPIGRSNRGAWSMPAAEPETTIGTAPPEAGRAGSRADTTWSPRQNFRSPGWTPSRIGWLGRNGNVMVERWSLRPTSKSPSG